LLDQGAPSASIVRESAPHYDSIKKVIHIRESGSPEQIALLDSFLETMAQELSKPRLAMVTTDAEGKITDVNPAFVEMCGYSLGDLYGRKPGDVLQGPDTDRDVVDEFRRAIKERRPFQCDLTNYAKDGTEYRVHIEMFPIFDPAGRLANFKAIERKI